jgi:hypothetical protein
MKQMGITFQSLATVFKDNPSTEQLFTLNHDLLNVHTIKNVNMFSVKVKTAMPNEAQYPITQVLEMKCVDCCT